MVKHPGIIIRERVIEPSGLNMTETAARLGIALTTLSIFTHGGSALTPELALRFEKVFGRYKARMDALLRLQLDYDIDRTRRSEKPLGTRCWSPLRDREPVPA